ncbi:putative HEAT repeat-containing domain protein [Trichinella spiralis]|uniref:putative HEAT repeat-containing domain protein n=1 Tax=Trichinella spiralis TaxID=6334 RepID=UPI0001EFF027|nr:putative HEAT repeat-containing domain protein [Trichinella spiralis]
MQKLEQQLHTTQHNRTTNIEMMDNVGETSKSKVADGEKYACHLLLYATATAKYAFLLFEIFKRPTKLAPPVGRLPWSRPILFLYLPLIIVRFDESRKSRNFYFSAPAKLVSQSVGQSVGSVAKTIIGRLLNDKHQRRRHNLPGKRDTFS